MQPRLHAGQGAKNKREKSKGSHYKRVHDEGAESCSSGSGLLNSVYYPAAEDDHLGWQLVAAPFDPMYTVNRRDREANAASKDSFFKKLKLRVDNTAAGEAIGDSADMSPSGTAAAPMPPSTKKAPVAAAGRFGFGMMGGAHMAEQVSDALNKPGKDKERRNDKAKDTKRKDKKDKDTAKKSKKTKGGHGDSM